MAWKSPIHKEVDLSSYKIFSPHLKTQIGLHKLKIRSSISYFTMWLHGRLLKFYYKPFTASPVLLPHHHSVFGIPTVPGSPSLHHQHDPHSTLLLVLWGKWFLTWVIFFGDERHVKVKCFIPESFDDLCYFVLCHNPIFFNVPFLL